MKFTNKSIYNYLYERYLIIFLIVSYDIYLYIDNIFKVYGMKEFPRNLNYYGVILALIGKKLRLKAFYITTILGYLISFVLSPIFDKQCFVEEYQYSITNSWVVWLVIYSFIMIGGIIWDMIKLKYNMCKIMSMLKTFCKGILTYFIAVFIWFYIIYSLMGYVNFMDSYYVLILYLGIFLIDYLISIENKVNI
ncbi:MAG: hypothetical protein BEN18_08770 [Epulopiscium sp. Nuni2H_MBin001]|nr:MAG: hypothetical protein BEN18_08770 [Epulopiscium sp. Nuni2H_MBin001]